MIALKRILVAAAALGLAAPAVAQDTGYDGPQFVKALKDGKNDDAIKLFKDKPTLANARDLDGLTALVAAIDNRDREWTGYLLQQGADPNLPSTGGETPLMAAARVGMSEAVDWLLQLGAKVDAENKMGETALIIAVEHRQVPVVRALVEAGANPDKADSAQGFSARDYAKRDTRTPELLRIIESQKAQR
jgi:ankyrin repeat protein